MKLFPSHLKLWLPIISFTFFIYVSRAQRIGNPMRVQTREQADSLLQILKTTNNDTLKMVIYKHLAIYAYDQKLDSFHYYNELRLKFAQKLNQKICEAEAYQWEVFTNLGNDLPKAFKSLNEAKRLAEDEANEKNMYIEPESPFKTAHERRIALLSTIQLNYAFIYMNTEKYDNAIENLHQAIHYAESIDDQVNLSNDYSNLATIYLRLNKLDTALTLYKKSADYSIKSGFRLFLGNNYRSIAYIYKTRKDYATSKKYILESIKSDEEEGGDRFKDYGYYDLSKLFEETHQHDSSIFYLKKAKASLEKFFGKNYDYRYMYYRLSNVFFAKNNPDSAYKYLKLATILTDSFHNAEIQDLKKYQDFFLDEQKKLKDAEKKNIQMQNYALLGGLGLLSMIGFILYRNNRQKQNTNIVLQEQKTKVESTVSELNSTLSELNSTQKQLIEKEKIASEAAIRLKELDTLKTRLYTNITHEFRTPLMVILGMNEDISSQLSAISPQEKLMADSSKLISHSSELIKRNGQNLLTLVNQMLDLSKLENGGLKLSYVHGDIVAFLKYIAESFHSLAENKGVTIHFLAYLEAINMDFDETRLQQIASNLLSNAIKFTPKGGNIYLSVENKNLVGFENLRGLAFKVKDTGIGISDQDLPYIFDRFYQVDATITREGEGTGIGLALTQELVKLMEGIISVKSILGQGTEFTVELPITRDKGTALSPTQFDGDKAVPLSLHVTQFDENDAVPTGDKVVPLSIQPKTILIADDNADVRTYISSILSTNYNLIFAKNGQECEELAFDHTPDLIISDVMMPLKDGFEVCKNLKSDERTSHIPIIMLTAKADMESKLQGIEQGADTYLMKPFNKEELLLQIKKLLELRQQLQKYYLSMINVETMLPYLKTDSIGDKAMPLSLQNAFVQKIKTIVETHLTNADFDVEQLSRMMALSHSQLHRKLSALTGLSATEFIRYIRLMKAKQLLLNSGYSIQAIAYDSGFSSAGYFSRVFKQEFGVTPQEWREKNPN